MFIIDSNDAKEMVPATLVSTSRDYTRLCVCLGGPKNSLCSDSLDPSPSAKHNVQPRCRGF